ncbi:hypothetical protein CHARACLAT_001227 [Characodon lateralis]|uniref:Uncharacterized protein n=1 Tax=Characodon lateralis TaxID=208331 RepID=A0ABU7DCN2_9TELE|nr:hypothetical protein [Characodon lateralis]
MGIICMMDLPGAQNSCKPKGREGPQANTPPSRCSSLMGKYFIIFCAVELFHLDKGVTDRCSCNRCFSSEPNHQGFIRSRNLEGGMITMRQSPGFPSSYSPCHALAGVGNNSLLLQP